MSFQSLWSILWRWLLFHGFPPFPMLRLSWPSQDCPFNRAGESQSLTLRFSKLSLQQNFEDSEFPELQRIASVLYTPSLVGRQLCKELFSLKLIAGWWPVLQKVDCWWLAFQRVDCECFKELMMILAKSWWWSLHAVDDDISRRIFQIMKRRSSSLMDHSLAFCLLISGNCKKFNMNKKKIFGH